MHYEVSISIDASPERIWAVLMDVERMPEWTSSMTEVRRLGGAPMAVGSLVRIKQPRLRAALWRVFELTPMRSFSWTTTSAGVTTDAVHTLATGPSGTEVTFVVRQRGLLAPLAGRLASSLTRRYVDTELNGLKARAESTHI